MAAILPYLAVFLTVGSAVVAADGERKKANAAIDAANFNKAISERNARLAREQSARDQETQGRSARRKIGTIRAAYGASGITPEGSPLDVLESSTAEAERERLNIERRGELGYLGYSESATLDGLSASTAAQQGQSNSASAYLSGLGAVASNYPRAA